MRDTPMRDAVAELIRAIPPHDALEAAHIDSTLSWIACGAPLYRLAGDQPPQHLVSYFILFDATEQKLLLVDHKKAGLWLPSGGHVEPGEHPQATVQREVMEELSVRGVFLSPTPLFLTVTPTAGNEAKHVDVSLWYLLQGDCAQELCFDEGEFDQIRWFALHELPFERSDPHLARFVAKLKAWIAA